MRAEPSKCRRGSASKHFLEALVPSGASVVTKKKLPTSPSPREAFSLAAFLLPGAGVAVCRKLEPCGSRAAAATVSQWVDRRKRELGAAHKLKPMLLRRKMPACPREARARRRGGTRGRGLQWRFEDAVCSDGRCRPQGTGGTRGVCLLWRLGPSSRLQLCLFLRLVPFHKRNRRRKALIQLRSVRRRRAMRTVSMRRFRCTRKR